MKKHTHIHKHKKALNRINEENNSNQKLTRRFRATQMLCSLLIFAMLTTTVPAAPKIIVNSAGATYQDIRFSPIPAKIAAGISLWTQPLVAFFFGGKATSNISSVKIYPGDLEIPYGKTVDLSAVAYNENDQAVSGVAFDWTIEDSEGKIKTRPLVNGSFQADLVGKFIVKAIAKDGSLGTINIDVVVDEDFIKFKNLQKDAEENNFEEINKLKKEGAYITSAISSRNVYKSEKVEEESLFSGLSDWLFGSAAEQEHGPSANNTETALNTTIVRPPDEDGWDIDNWWTADDPGNQTGNPTGTSPDAGAGNGNFQISAPVLSLAGRGIDLNLALNYNSRLWSKAGNKMTYDADKGDPSPGWSLGFGKMIFMGTDGTETGGCMLVDADGTRRGYAGSATISNHGQNIYTVRFDGNTADGSLIDYECEVFHSPAAGYIIEGSAKLPNGTQVLFRADSDAREQAYPTRITDAQGNYILITYRDDSGPKIETITDTMGRVLTFNYDTLDRLITIDVPKFNNAGTRTAVRLHYKPITLNPGFASGITTDTATNTPYVLDAIYYPGTNTGYWFNDSDSYSSYGMITKVIEQRGMSWSGTAGTQGTITQGTMSKQEVYNYTLVPDYSLTDAPTYTTQSQTWDGMTTSAAVTSYAVNFTPTAPTPRTIEVTRPNGLRSKQYLYNIAENAPANQQYKNGLLYKEEVCDANLGACDSNNMLSEVDVTWEEGDYDTPRPIKVESIDHEIGKTLITDNTYGAQYNELTSVKEFDFDGTTLLRETKNTYKHHVNNHIFNMITTKEIYNGSNIRMSKSDYIYDDDSATGVGVTFADTPGVIMHDQRYNPYTTDTKNGICTLYDPEYPRQRVCLEWEQISVYEARTALRGNVTNAKAYADAQTPAASIEQNHEYDNTGNIVLSLGADNQATRISYDDPNTTEIDTQYAYPVSQKVGSPDANSPIQIDTSVVYDFNTGLTKETTDANGRVNTSAYDADTLRPTSSMTSAGGYTEYTYDDAAMTMIEEIKDDQDDLASRNKKYLNGLGNVKKEESNTTETVVDAIQTEYDNSGNVKKQTRPYRAGDTPQWAEFIYDVLNRNTEILSPDGSSNKAFYNESTRPSSASTASSRAGYTLRVVDSWGRERWTLYDRSSRVLETVEPEENSNGSVFSAGNMVTKYNYDTLGKVVSTQQGSQNRFFKYDSLGRMTRQKLAEQSATLNDAGTYVGAGNSGAQWSEAFWYDANSNITLKMDARGVRSHYSYNNGGSTDPLNRLQSIIYDASGNVDTSSTIHAAPLVTYQYVTSGDLTRVLQARTQSLLTEDYQYDVEGRVSEYKQTIDYRTSYPMTTNYTYDSLGRIDELLYPAQYGLSGDPRKEVKHSYDVASRLSSLKVDGIEQAGNIVYNASDQTESIKIGPNGKQQVTELYDFNDQNGLITHQEIVQNETALVELSYQYGRINSNGSLSGMTGQLTKIIDENNNDKDREYTYDALGRLKKAEGGNNKWTQQYSYDRYGNRTNVIASGNAADNTPIPQDGFSSITFNSTNNRITTAGFQYDAAGNQTRALSQDGNTWLRYEYDGANRLQVVKDDAGNYLQAYQFGSTNARLMDYDYVTNKLILIATNGGKTLAEYTELTSTVPIWQKSYTYLGESLHSTLYADGSGGETSKFNHPDRLGTRALSDQKAETFEEQVTLPFGTALNAESTITNYSKRFTSYDRSDRTGLDYAINRTYDSKLGRFTQVDPLAMSATDFLNPQTLNLYSYAANDPINRTDSNGLFWGFFKKLFKFLAKILVYIAVVVAIIAAVISVVGLIGTFSVAGLFGAISSVASAIEQVLKLAGFNRAAAIFGIISKVAGIGTATLGVIKSIQSALKKISAKIIAQVVKNTASLASKVLSLIGLKTASDIFGFISFAAGFVESGIKTTFHSQFGFSVDEATFKVLAKHKWLSLLGKVTETYSWKKSGWAWFKFVRGAAEKIANLVGAKKLASYIGLVGLAEDGVSFIAAIKGFDAKFGDYPNETVGKIKFARLLWKFGESIKRGQAVLKPVNSGYKRITALAAP